MPDRAQNSNSEGLRYDVARAHSRLGDINRLLEKHEGAIQEYNQAISRFESLAKDYPGKTEYRQALAYAHNWLGETLRIWRWSMAGPRHYSLHGRGKAIR